MCIKRQPVDLKIQVSRVDVLGSTAFSQEELAAVTAPFVGQEVTFEQLLAIRTAVTDLYTSRGFTTSGAFLPPQDISTGVIKIQVVEGELERIEVKGLARLQPDYVRSRIAIASQPPLNIRRLEEALQVLQLNPLFSSVQAELSAGTVPGRSVLSLKLREADAVSSAFTVENRNSPSVGSIGGTAALTHLNLVGLGDRFTGEVGRTQGVTTYDVGYTLPINPQNGTLSLRYANSTSRIIEEPFGSLDINSNAETYSVGIRQPLLLTPSTEFALGLTLDLRQSQTFLLNNIPFSFSLGPENGFSRATVLRFSQDLISRSPNRVLAARSQFSFGLGALGATVNDTGTDGRFFNWVGQIQGVQSLGEDFIVIARVGAQLTGDSLLPLEQFSIGGIDTVRGYRQNQRVGDSGVVGAIELRVPIVRDERAGLIQVVPFFDIGTVWNSRSAVASPATLASVGLGLRWQIDPYFFARLDYGIPLNRIDTQGNSLQDNGFFFSIQLQPF